MLVAIWEKPFIFQGCFTITHISDGSKKSLFFRCACNLENKMNIIDSDFSPYHYQFTHLQNNLSSIDLTTTDNELEHAMYILKYALNITLEKMLQKPNQYLTYIDEVAMSGISREIQHYYANREQANIKDHIGFGVSINFTPTEMMGQTAAATLVQLCSHSALSHKKGHLH